MNQLMGTAVLFAGVVGAGMVSASCLSMDRINTREIQRCIESGVDVDSPSFAYRTMLFRLAEIDEAHAGYVDNSSGERIPDDPFKFLVEDAGANVNLSDELGDTLLHKVRNPSLVQLLIDAGAEVDAKNAGGYPALADGRKPLVSIQALIKAPANVNATIGDGRQTLLHNYLTNKDASYVSALIDGGAEVRILSEEAGPICWLFGVAGREEYRGGHTEILQSLINARGEMDVYCSSDTTSHGSNGESPLMRAIHVGQKDAVAILLAVGSDPNLHGGGAMRVACDYYHHFGGDRITGGAIIGMLRAAGAQALCGL